MNAVAYLRCSSDKQARRDLSIPAQRREIERRAETDGLPVVRWFEDEGISGKDIGSRPGINALLDYMDAHRGEISTLYVYDFKRMARNADDAYYIRRRVKATKAKIIALTQPTVEDEGVSAMLTGLYDGLAAMERLHLSKVVKRGQKEALLQGWWPFNKAPFGFRSVGIDNGRGARRFRLLVDPDEAEVVRLIFQLSLDGRGQKAISAELNRRGISPPARGDLARERELGWTAKHIFRVLTDPMHYGAVEWPEEDGPVVLREDHHEGIISKDTFLEARRVAKDRTRSPKEMAVSQSRQKMGDHGIFTPWLRCSACGGRMTVNRGGTPDNRIYYYVCSTRLQSATACTGMNVKVADLDPVVLDLLEREVLSDAALNEIIRTGLEWMDKHSNGELNAARAGLEERIAEISKKLQRLALSVAEGNMPMEDVAALATPLRERREELRAELAVLPEPKPTPPAATLKPEAIKARFRELWTDKNLTVRRAALNELLETIRVEPGQVVIRYGWPGSGNYTYQLPPGPPEGSAPIIRGWVLCGDVSRPKVYVTAAL